LSIIALVAMVAECCRSADDQDKADRVRDELAWRRPRLADHGKLEFVEDEEV
jgi:hypothetical protein